MIEAKRLRLSPFSLLFAGTVFFHENSFEKVVEMTKIPSSMKAMVLTGHGGMEKLEYHEDWPTPSPGPNEVLVKVHACGMNNTDVNTRSGWYSKAVTEATTGEGYDAVSEEDPTWGCCAVDLSAHSGR